MGAVVELRPGRVAHHRDAEADLWALVDVVERVQRARADGVPDAPADVVSLLVALRYARVALHDLEELLLVGWR